MRAGFECYLCGRPASSGKGDHVPPKGLFAFPRPGNLITVPCCEKCNRAFSKDEEYFRNNVSAISDFANAGEIWKTVRRSYKRRPAIRGSMIERTSPVQIGDQVLPLFKFEKDRTDRILLKIAKGLVFHHYGRRVANGTPFETYLAENMPDSVRGLIPKMPHRGRFGTTFCYVGGMAEDEPDVGLWLLVFYVSKVFVVSFNTRSSD